MKKKISIPKITNKDVKKGITKANDFSKFLGENKYFLIALGVGVGGYLIYSKVSKGLDSVGSGISNALENPDTDFIEADIIVDQTNTTISVEDANFLAKALLEAFNTYSFWFNTPSTDEDKVSEVFEKIKTPDDFKILYSAFGKRKYINGGTPTTYVGKKMSEEYDLLFWLREELSGVFESDLYKKVKSIVESAGMIL